MNKQVFLTCALAGILAGCGGQKTNPVQQLKPITSEQLETIKKYETNKMRDIAFTKWDDVLSNAGYFSPDIDTMLPELSFYCKLGDDWDSYTHTRAKELCPLVNEGLRLEQKTRLCSAWAEWDFQGILNKWQKQMPDWDGDVKHLINLRKTDRYYFVTVDRDKDNQMRINNPNYVYCLSVAKDRDSCYLKYGVGKKELREDVCWLSDMEQQNGNYILVSNGGGLDSAMAVKKADVTKDFNCKMGTIYYVSTETVAFNGVDFPVLKRTDIDNRVGEVFYNLIYQYDTKDDTPNQYSMETMKRMCDNLPTEKAAYDEKRSIKMQEITSEMAQSSGGAVQ